VLASERPLKENRRWGGSLIPSEKIAKLIFRSEGVEEKIASERGLIKDIRTSTLLRKKMTW